MATKDKRELDEVVVAAKIRSAQRLMAKLEAAHKAGTLRKLSTTSKHKVYPVRVKAAA